METGERADAGSAGGEGDARLDRPIRPDASTKRPWSADVEVAGEITQADSSGSSAGGAMVGGPA